MLGEDPWRAWVASPGLIDGHPCREGLAEQAELVVEVAEAACEGGEPAVEGVCVAAERGEVSRSSSGCCCAWLEPGGDAGAQPVSETSARHGTSLSVFEAVDRRWRREYTSSSPGKQIPGCSLSRQNMVLPEDQTHMAHALALAQDAASVREVPVGAVVVCDGKVIAAAHNRRELDQDPTAHAELIAMRMAAEVLGSWRLEGCTVYVTLEPCPMCAGAMVLSRIERCVYGCTDPKGGFLGTLGDLSQDPRLNHRFEVTPGVMADECADALRSFFRALRAEKKQK